MDQRVKSQVAQGNHLTTISCILNPCDLKRAEEQWKEKELSWYVHVEYLIHVCYKHYNGLVTLLHVDWTSSVVQRRGGLLEIFDHMLSLDTWVSSCGGGKYM